MVGSAALYELRHVLLCDWSAPSAWASTPAASLSVHLSLWFYCFSSSGLRPLTCLLQVSSCGRTFSVNCLCFYLLGSTLTFSSSFYLSFRPPLCAVLAGLCRGALQKRSGQMVSDDFRALLISTGNSLVLLLTCCWVSAGPVWTTFKLSLTLLPCST